MFHLSVADKSSVVSGLAYSDDVILKDIYHHMQYLEMEGIVNILVIYGPFSVK